MTAHRQFCQVERGHPCPSSVAHPHGSRQSGECLMCNEIALTKCVARGIRANQDAEIITAPEQRREHRGPGPEGLKDLDEALVQARVAQKQRPARASDHSGMSKL